MLRHPGHAVPQRMESPASPHRSPANDSSLETPATPAARHHPVYPEIPQSQEIQRTSTPPLLSPPHTTQPVRFDAINNALYPAWSFYRQRFVAIPKSVTNLPDRDSVHKFRQWLIHHSDCILHDHPCQFDCLVMTPK